MSFQNNQVQGSQAPAQVNQTNDSHVNFNQDALILVTLLIAMAVQVGHHTANVQTSEIKANADTQDQLIAQESHFQFDTHFTMPDKPKFKGDLMTASPEQFKEFMQEAKDWKAKYGKLSKDDYMGQVQATNQRQSALLNVIGDMLNTVRQKGQIEDTNSNSTVQELLQYLQVNSRFLQIVSSVSDRVTTM